MDQVILQNVTGRYVRHHSQMESKIAYVVCLLCQESVGWYVLAHELMMYRWGSPYACTPTVWAVSRLV